MIDRFLGGGTFPTRMPSTSQSSPAHSRESFAIRERTSSGERASSACTRTGASIFGQTAARQSLQSRNSAQQLFLMQHLKAVRALAPLSTSCASPSSPQKMGHTHQQLAASTFHLILVQFSQEQRGADAVQTRSGQCGQRRTSRFRTRSTSGWRVEADGLALSGVAHGGGRGRSLAVAPCVPGT